MKRKKIVTFLAISAAVFLFLLFGRNLAIKNINRSAETSEALYRKSHALGNTRKATREVSRAVKLFKKVLSLDPNNPKALSGMARLKIERKNYADAFRYSTRAVKADPAHPENQYYLGYSAMRLKRFDMAQSSFNRTLELQPGHQDSIEGLARLFVLQKKPGRARELLEKNIESGNGSPGMYSKLYYILRDQGLMDKAIGVTEESLSLAKPPRQAYNILADRYKRKGEKEKAEKLVEIWQKKFPDDPGEFIRMARSVEKKKPGLAEKLYLQAARIELIKLDRHNLNERDLSANFVLAYFYRRQKLYGDGIKVLERLLVYLPNSRIIYFNLGVFHYLAQEYCQAERELSRCIAIDRNAPFSLNQLAWVYLTAPSDGPCYKPGDALSLARRAVKKSPRTAAYVDTLARALYANGKIDQAMKEYKKNEKHRRSFAYALYGLALCHYRRGENAMAQEYTERAIKHNFRGWRLVQNDQDIPQIRDNPRLKELIKNKPDG